MSGLIEWLNNNSGAIQALSTMVLVGITGWYAILTYRLSNAAYKQVELLNQQNRVVLLEKVSIVSARAHKILNFISTFDSPRRLMTMEDEKSWAEDWFVLEQVGKSLGDPVVDDLLSQALDDHRKIRIYIELGNTEINDQKRVLSDIVISLAKLSSIYLIE